MNENKVNTENENLELNQLEQESVSSAPSEDIEKYFEDLISQSDEKVLKGYRQFPDPQKEKKQEKDVKETREVEELVEEAPVKAEQPSQDEEPQVDQPQRQAQAPRVPQGFKPEQIGDIPDEVFSSLPDQVKEAITALKNRNAELLHQYKSREGRLSALDRTVNELRKKIAEYEFALQKQTPSLKNQEHEAKREAVSEKIASGISLEELEQDKDYQSLLEVDPVMARLLKRQAELLIQKAEQAVLSKINQHVSKVDEFVYDRYLEEQTQKLLSVVPNAYEVMTYVDPETGFSPWKNWVESVPESIRRLALSDKADDVIYALKLYRDDMEAYYGAQSSRSASQQEQRPAEQPHNHQAARASNPQSANLSRIAEARKRKLEAAATGAPVNRVPSHRPVPSEYEPETLEDQMALFEEIIRSNDEQVLKTYRR